MEYLECDNIICKNWYNENILLTVNQFKIATITLNRIDKHNALDQQMVEGLNKAFDCLDDYLAEYESNIKLLILKANGKTFCAGADLNLMQEMVGFDYQENYQDAVNLARVLERLDDFKSPTIAIVQGNAYGGGVGFVCCCDFAIAIKDATFCLSEVKLGLIPAVISPYVVATLGYKTAMRYVLTADTFDAMHAHSINMLSHVEKSDKIIDKTLEQLIYKLMHNGPVAMQKAKGLIKQISNHKDDLNLISKTAEYIASIRVSPEGQEGLKAFIEKRKPNWIINDK